MTCRSVSVLSRHVLLLGVALLAVSACASILPAPPAPQLYVLRPQLELPSGPSVSWRLSVTVPDAPASLDTVRIALTRSPTTMDYFANAAWNDRVPLLLQRLLIENFDASGRIVAVSRDTAGLENDYLLTMELRDFQARYETSDAAPEIVVGIQARLVRMPQREILATVNVVEQAAADRNNLDAIVAAFNRAVGAAIVRIAGWTLNVPAKS